MIDNSKNISEYIVSVRHFCSIIENHQSANTKEFLLVIQASLIDIYKFAKTLPEITLQDPMDYDDSIDSSFWDKANNSIADRLVESRYYLYVFNPIDQTDTEPSYGDLLDDIGDIYKDLKRSLSIFDLNTDSARENSIWQFKFDFDNHWGDHCVNAIYALHYYLK